MVSRRRGREIWLGAQDEDVQDIYNLGQLIVLLLVYVVTHNSRRPSIK